jgi:hypothetical protein
MIWRVEGGWKFADDFARRVEELQLWGSVWCDAQHQAIVSVSILQF